MMRKTVRFLQTCLMKIGRWFRRKPETAPVEAMPEEAAWEGGTSASEHLCVRRMKKVLAWSGLRQRRGNAPGIWSVEVENFADAYRFMLKICDRNHIKSIRQGGHVRYMATLPDGEGNILLSERVGNRKNALAVMTFTVKRMTEIKEIRFCARDGPRGCSPFA